jgi:hypothetical protein
MENKEKLSQKTNEGSLKTSEGSRSAPETSLKTSEGSLKTPEHHSLNDKDLLAFKAITEFVSAIATIGKQKSLKLYKRLIDAVKIVHSQAMHKHNSIFKKFCQDNKNSILNSDESKMVNFIIVYNDRIYIDLKPIFKACDAESKKDIFAHLLTISAILTPESKAKSVLKTMESKNGNENFSNSPSQPFVPTDNSVEGDFLSNLMKNVGSVAEKNTGGNPMDSIAEIMSSGMLTDMMTSLATGNLDMRKLMSGVKNMINSIDTQGDENTSEAVSMLKGVVGNLENGEKPDLKGMLSTVAKIQGMNQGVDISEDTSKDTNKEDNTKSVVLKQ